jgi:WASH complex subunit strumpellin
MLRVLNIDADYKTSMQIIADLSYGWEVIDNYTAHMQHAVKRNPRMTVCCVA